MNFISYILIVCVSATDQEENLYQNTENLYQNVAVSGARALQNTEL